MDNLGTILASYPTSLTLRHLGASLKEIAPSTIALRHSDYRVASWLGQTQTWAWKMGKVQGDAIVVTTGQIGNVRSYMVLRLGSFHTVVDISGGGIAGFFRSYGVTTTVAVPEISEAA